MMKLLGAVGFVVSVTAVADADPVPTPTASDQLDYYVELAGVGGIAQGAAFLAPMVEGGHWLGNGAWWLHAAIVGGQASELDEGGSGAVWQGRLGIEARDCAVPDIICGSIGADVAISHVKYSSGDDYGDSMDT